MDDEKDAKERYDNRSQRGSLRSASSPKKFNLDSFLVDLLPSNRRSLRSRNSMSFHIADWIQPHEQRMVMSHELTHALQDQVFSHRSLVPRRQA